MIFDCRVILMPKRSILVSWTYLAPMKSLCVEIRNNIMCLANKIFSTPISPRTYNGVTFSRASFRNKSYAVTALLLLEHFNHSIFWLCPSVSLLTINLCFMNLFVVSKCHAVLALRFKYLFLWIGFILNGKVPFIVLSMLRKRTYFTFEPLEQRTPRAHSSPKFL